MGTMVPGKQYIYEKSGGVTYRREYGSQDRVAIGWDETHIDIEEAKLWGEIRRAAKTNPGLQDLLNQAIEFYQLSKNA